MLLAGFPTDFSSSNGTFTSPPSPSSFAWGWSTEYVNTRKMSKKIIYHSYLMDMSTQTYRKKRAAAQGTVGFVGVTFLDQD